LGGTVAPTIFHRLLEVEALLRYDYQGGLVLTERANLLRLRGNVILFESTVSQSLTIENSAEESFLLAFSLLSFLLHDGGALLLGIRIARVRHVNAEDVDRVVIRRRRDISRVPTELQVVNLSFVSTASEHKWTGRVLGVNFPDADECALLTRRRQQITMSIQRHRRD